MYLVCKLPIKIDHGIWNSENQALCDWLYQEDRLLRSGVGFQQDSCSYLYHTYVVDGLNLIVCSWNPACSRPWYGTPFFLFFMFLPADCSMPWFYVGVVLGLFCFNVSCKCTHGRCYSKGLGCDVNVSCTCTHGRCYSNAWVVFGFVLTHVHTWSMLRRCWGGVGVGC